MADGVIVKHMVFAGIQKSLNPSSATYEGCVCVSVCDRWRHTPVCVYVWEGACWGTCVLHWRPLFCDTCQPVCFPPPPHGRCLVLVQVST